MVLRLASASASGEGGGGVFSWIDEWANVASVFGLVVTLIGFSITIYVASRSRTVAQQARDAIVRFDSTAAFGEAIATIEELMRLQRQEAWEVLPDRYIAARKRLVEVRAANNWLSDEQKEVITAAMQHLQNITGSIERSLATKAQPPGVTRINDILAA